MATQLHQAFTVTAVRQDNYRTKTLFLEPSLPAQPGQFVMAWLPGVGEKPFSLSGSDPLALTVAAVGPVSEAILRLRRGKRLWLRGPLGRGFEPFGERLLLVAGGYGAAPLRFLAEVARAQAKTVEVCLGASTAIDLTLMNEFEKMGCGVRLATEDGSQGAVGLVTETARLAIQDHRPDGLYACGPVKMLEAVEILAEQSHLPCQLSWEAHMRCGMGVCGSCELERQGHGTGWLTCLDGPVERKLQAAA
jgi:dihydroorotate dehydrogenase electron transfer subunit